MLLRKSPIELTNYSELELTRHVVNLSRENVGIDVCPYPLGSCTMKFNPRALEKAAGFIGFSTAHPLAPEHTVQGSLEVIKNFTDFLVDLLGMDGGTFSPYAGAQGEFVGLHLIKAYHQSNGQVRDEILIPNAAHGTNPASASMLGYKIITLSTTKEGDVDVEEIKRVLSSKTAGLMLTNPNTLGIFSPSILQISEAVHSCGGLLYYDGANLNPLAGVVKVGEMGFDVLHLNLHKTFATFHGSGGPGSGPVFCKKQLLPFLPAPLVEETAEGYRWQNKSEQAIGRPSPFQGNFGIVLMGYLYSLLLGKSGLQKSAYAATLHANYVKQGAEKFFESPFKAHSLHEFILSMTKFKEKGITALDLAKRMIDFGIHPPTIYFPRIIEEGFLFEPTESESFETLNRMIDCFRKLSEEGENNPDMIKQAPHTTAIQRPDEAKAAKDMKVV